MEQSSWGSYPKIYHIGHPALASLFDDEVVIEEKVDGSQFSFGMFATVGGAYELRMRSKGAPIYIEAPEPMFEEIVKYVVSIKDKLVHNWTYVGEYLKRPKHNTLCYDRIPQNHLALFDIRVGKETYTIDRTVKEGEALRLGFDVVPELFRGKVEKVEEFRALLETESFLGGAKIEGFVIKNYYRFGLDGKTLMGKFVSEAFKECHTKAWNESNPSNKSAILRISEKYQTQARWMKAVQFLRDIGALEGSPRDIGNLIAKVKKDVEEECKEEIKNDLWKAFGDQIIRRATLGLPTWYKEDYLVKQQFKEV